jgi:hypothetical protein
MSVSVGTIDKTGRSVLNNDTELSAALLTFNGEAALYCEGISDPVAQNYAISYARMLQDRAKGVEIAQTRFPVGLFEPNRNLIKSTLDRMSERLFLSK